MNHTTTASTTVTDPVCGMTIDPAKAVGSSSYNGDSYHFCSRGCETKFDAAPAQYASATAGPPVRHPVARPGTLLLTSENNGDRHEA